MFVKFTGILAVIGFTLALAACGAEATPSPAARAEEIPVEPQPLALAETPAPTPPPAASPTVDPLEWQPVELPEAGLRLIAPPGWQGLEDGGYWSDVSGERLSVSVQPLPAGAQPRGVFLPEEFDLVETRSLSTGLGMADCLQIAITRQHGQATTTRYEWHILVNSGDRPAVDFSASAASSSVLAELRPLLEKLAQTASWIP